MKKIFALTLALTMLISLAACGVSGTDAPDTADQSGSDEVSVSSDIAESTKEGSDTETFSEDTSAEASETVGETTSSIDFQEVTVVDNDFCTVKITGIDPDNMWGYSLNVFLENKTSDKTFTFALDSASVNGVQADPLFASEVAAGKKANETISFFDTEFDGNDIGEFSDIELNFRVHDSNDWLTDSVAEETAHIYPLGKDKAKLFVRAPADTDNVIIDNENVTVTVIGYDSDDIFGYAMKLFLVNKTGESVMFSIDEASVNGFMCDPFYADSVSPGKCSFSSVSWFEDTLSESGITDTASIETIEFTLRAYSENDWLADDLANVAIALNP